MRGGAMAIASSGGAVLVEIAATIWLARLLEPAEFGRLAMVSVFFVLVSKLRGFGTASATVQREDLGGGALSHLFWINLRLSAIVAVAAAAFGPVLGWFYGEPVLGPMAAVMAASSLVVSVAAVHEGLLRRTFRFGTIATVTWTSTLIASASAVIAALYGWGVWALVVQFAGRQVIEATGLVLAARWWPTWRAADGGRAAREMIGFGGNLSASNVIAWFGRNLDFILVGWLSGATALGLYHKAFRLAALPFQQIYRPAMSVAMSRLSRLQDDPERYRATTRGAMMLLFSVVVPLVCYLGVEAEPFILLLGEQWRGAIPLFQILLVGTFCNGLLLILKWMYQAEGRTRDLLRWTLASSPVLAGGICLGVPWGPTGIAVAFDVTAALLVLPGYLALCRSSALRPSDFFAPLPPILAAAAVAALAAGWVTRAGDVAGPLRILAGAGVAGAVYPLAYVLLPGGSSRARRIWAIVSPAVGGPPRGGTA